MRNYLQSSCWRYLQRTDIYTIYVFSTSLSPQGRKQVLQNSPFVLPTRLFCQQSYSDKSCTIPLKDIRSFPSNNSGSWTQLFYHNERKKDGFGNLLMTLNVWWLFRSCWKVDFRTKKCQSFRLSSILFILQLLEEDFF